MRGAEPGEAHLDDAVDVEIRDRAAEPSAATEVDVDVDRGHRAALGHRRSHLGQGRGLVDELAGEPPAELTGWLNLPVLIFSGNLDPITPPQRGEEVAKYLPNSRHVVIPEAGHGVDGLSDGGCVDRIIIDFMDKGSVKDLDTSCVDQMAPPPFVTK